MNWDLTNNLLLILSLNQPLMKDLRIVATYLRAVDTVERLIRHARDIARSDRSLDENADPSLRHRGHVKSMHGSLNSLIDITIECLTNGGEVPADEVNEHWKAVKTSHAEAVAALSIQSDTLGGKAMRLEVINIVNRGPMYLQHRSMNGMWHHALNSENIILD